MKHYLLKNADGSVQVMIMVPQEEGSYSTPEAEIAKWHPDKQKEHQVQSWREIKPAHVPKDRTFRDAWCDVTQKPTVDIDMTKARDIQRNRLRAMREPKLAALDVEMTRAFADPAKQAAIDAKRQALRDVTKDPLIDAAKTPEELIAAIPDVLK